MCHSTVRATRVLERLSNAHGRILGATHEEIAAAREAVAALLRHPLLLAAARAEREGECYRETPVTYRLESGVLIEGYVDLAYRDGNSVVVVDFKTDRELDGEIEQTKKWSFTKNRCHFMPPRLAERPGFRHRRS